MTVSARAWYLVIPVVAGIGIGGAVIAGREDAEHPATIPAGTTLVVALDQTVSADASRPGDVITFRTAERLGPAEAAVVPLGTEVRGVVTDATSPDWGASPPHLGLRLTAVVIDGEAFPISTEKYWFSTPEPPTGGRVALPAGRLLQIRLTRPLRID
jgi:hypothetical protein